MKEKELGWTISALAQETGIPDASLSNWLEFYRESERIKAVPIIGRESSFEGVRVDHFGFA